MADSIEISNSIPTKSYETALCIIPNPDQCRDIDRLRSLYDKAYEKWPPHINLIYPFVAPDLLHEAQERIQTHLRNTLDGSAITIALDAAGVFKNRNDITVFLTSKDTETLEALRSSILKSLAVSHNPTTFHLTVGQPEDKSMSSHQYLLDKVNLFPILEVNVVSLAILIREKQTGNGNAAGQMRYWGDISLRSSNEALAHARNEFWITENYTKESPEEPELSLTGDLSLSSERRVHSGATYTFHGDINEWRQCVHGEPADSKTLSVSSYNVLIDSEYPPARDRDSLLVETILDKTASSDVLILQEVSDDFLSYLLESDEIRKVYPYASNGPPRQSDIGPLPSLRNIIVLSKWYFSWKFVPFHRRHKGAIVASFRSQLSDDGVDARLIVAGVHLTCGLTDGSVAAKKVQLQNLMNYLKREHPTDPWIVAGDFNLPTSRYTIDEAAKNKSVSYETTRTLASIETMLYETELLDAWAAARVDGVDETANLDADDLFEGEEGATFNPRENALAAAISGTSRNRPQRYDRILMRPQETFTVARFNQFGLPRPVQDMISVPSDHYGIRAQFKMLSDVRDGKISDAMHQCNVHHKSATAELANTYDLVDALSKRSVFPAAEDEDRHRQAFALIKDVLLGSENSQSTDIPMVVVSVGSYALNVWTPKSDIDCLVVGTIRSKTFFQLARQRIRKAEPRGVRLLRKVEANTGTMLELSVNGVNVDLQYCPATNVVQRWSESAKLPASDPVFNLSILSLRKLKPLRDLYYIQRTLPSTAAFRLAYHFIRQWAVERGIYSAKFGYFGGVHITIMLTWICKRIARDTGSVSAGDIILSFFHHYSHFNWEKDMVYDAFFHKNKPRYQRSAREAMVVLGFHAPNSNIAHTATVPGRQVLVSELARANELLSTPGMTWEQFFAAELPEQEIATFTPAVHSFLTRSESYVKIDIQYWGRTLNQGKSLVGWLESRCINFVVDIHKALPYIIARIWPARFAESDTNTSEGYYHGCYLISLSQSDSSVSASKESRAEAKEKLQKTFDRFMTQVKGDEKNFDESTSWVDVSLAKASDLKNLQLDTREWGDYMPDMEPDSDDEEEIEEDEDESSAQQASRKLPLRSGPSGTANPVSAARLRPASDVLNRLRWDSNLDPSDYIVGYEDRFLGAKETSLAKWKTEQTDEEFIPQHRILYFKKKGEDGGELVWERATRIDRIFGSGLGDGR